MSPTEGRRSPPCPRMASRSWCCGDVMPASAARWALHLRNRRIPVRNSSSRENSSSSDIAIGLYRDTIYPSLSMKSTPRRTIFLTVLAAVLGLLGGGAAYALVHLIAMLTNLCLFHRVSWTLPRLRSLDPGPGLVIAAMGGGLVVSLLAKWSPVIRGHGIPEAMEAILERQSRIQPR